VGTNRLGYESTWVRIDLGTNRLRYETTNIPKSVCLNFSQCYVNNLRVHKKCKKSLDSLANRYSRIDAFGAGLRVVSFGDVTGSKLASRFRAQFHTRSEMYRFLIISQVRS